MILFGGLIAATAPAAAQIAVPETYGDSLRWYPRAAEAGSPEAQFLLGLQFETGTSRAKDLAKAAEWFGRAARADHEAIRDKQRIGV